MIMCFGGVERNGQRQERLSIKLQYRVTVGARSGADVSVAIPMGG